MNHIFSTVWNTVRKCLVAVNEAAGSKQARGAGRKTGAKAGVLAAALGIVLVPSVLSTAVAAASTPTNWGAEEGKYALVFGTEGDWFSNAQSVVQLQQNLQYGYDWMKQEASESSADWQKRVNGLATRFENNDVYQFGSLTDGILQSGVFVLGSQNVKLFDNGNDITVQTPIFVMSDVLSEVSGKNSAELTIGDSSAANKTHAVLSSLTVGDSVTGSYVQNEATEVQRNSMQDSIWSLSGKLEVQNADVAVNDLYVGGKTKSHVAKDSSLTIENGLIALITGGYLQNEGTVTVNGSLKTIKELRFAGQIENSGKLEVKGEAEIYSGLHTTKGAESKFGSSLILGGGKINGPIFNGTNKAKIGDEGQVVYPSTAFNPEEEVEKEYGIGSTQRSLNEGSLTVDGAMTVVGAWIMGNANVQRGSFENAATGKVTADTLAVNGFFNNVGGTVNATKE